MNKLIKYVFYVALGAAIGEGCYSREAKSQSMNGIESKIIGIEPIYDEPKEKDNKTERYKR